MTKYTISVEDELWEKFKQTVAKDRTINEAIVEMIRRREVNRGPGEVC